MSIDDIFSFASDTNTDVLGIYDDSMLFGFAVILMNDKCGYVYFIAIDKNVRSKGYGSAATETYSNLQIVLDFEEIDEDAENYAQRIRRKNFYLRNGFHETGNYTLLREQRFEVVCIMGKLWNITIDKNTSRLRTKIDYPFVKAYRVELALLSLVRQKVR